MPLDVREEIVLEKGSRGIKVPVRAAFANEHIDCVRSIRSMVFLITINGFLLASYAS